MATPNPETDASQTDPAVVAFLRDLDHPLKREIEAVRQLILRADPGIHEAIKRTAPSFRTTDFFATFPLRARDRVQMVFHMGAKAFGALVRDWIRWL